MTIDSNYKELVEQLKKGFHLKSTLNLLHWDEQVNLPPKSTENRAKQIATLSEVVHNECTTPAIGKYLDKLEAEKGILSPEQWTVVRETRKAYDRARKIPGEFVARKAESQSIAYKAWTESIKTSDFEQFAPHLLKQIDYAIEEANFVGSHDNPYDYWVDQHDPGLTSEFIEKRFSELKKGLLPIVKQIADSSIKPNSKILKNFSIDDQEVFMREVTERLGFDYERGRIDKSVHPFCSGNPDDVRMTTRFQKDVPLDSLLSAIHEAGHALYEQGLPKAHIGTPLSEHIGMAVHESQSRMWENQVGRSRGFWKFWEPRYRELFSEQLKDIDSELFYLTVNAVERNPIRVDSDEVTYNLHIILRFELEKALFDGSVKVKDLPETWNRLSQEIIGLTPKNNKEGVLQDVHWSGGYFGYFPSYCLGNMIAAQLWNTVNKQIPTLEESFAQGNYKPLLDWLRTNVHQYGKQYNTQEIVEKVTGEALSPKYLLAYLSERYLPLYSLNSV